MSHERTGVSEELAKTFPNLRFAALCYGGITRCILKKGQPEDQCDQISERIQMKEVTGMSSAPGKDGRYELVEIRPLPAGCKNCSRSK